MTTDTTRMPTLETVRQWMRDNPDFAARVRHARQIGCLTTVDRILECADTLLAALRAAPLQRGDIARGLLEIEEQCVSLADQLIEGLTDPTADPSDKLRRTDRRQSDLH